MSRQRHNHFYAQRVTVWGKHPMPIIGVVLMFAIGWSVFCWLIGVLP